MDIYDLLDRFFRSTRNSDFGNIDLARSSASVFETASDELASESMEGIFKTEEEAGAVPAAAAPNAVIRNTAFAPAPISTEGLYTPTSSEDGVIVKAAQAFFRSSALTERGIGFDSGERPPRFAVVAAFPRGSGVSAGTAASGVSGMYFPQAVFFRADLPYAEENMTVRGQAAYPFLYGDGASSKAMAQPQGNIDNMRLKEGSKTAGENKGASPNGSGKIADGSYLQVFSDPYPKIFSEAFFAKPREQPALRAQIGLAGTKLPIYGAEPKETLIKTQLPRSNGHSRAADCVTLRFNQRSPEFFGTPKGIEEAKTGTAEEKSFFYAPTRSSQSANTADVYGAVLRAAAQAGNTEPTVKNLTETGEPLGGAGLIFAVPEAHAAVLPEYSSADEVLTNVYKGGKEGLEAANAVFAAVPSREAAFPPIIGSARTVIPSFSDGSLSDIRQNELAEIRKTDNGGFGGGSAEIHIDMSNMTNTISGETDIEEIVSSIAEAVSEAVGVVSEKAWD
ncbi:MAG: hypothetical protein NC394_06825 [Bacteroides sp.]|nr:hypothetical protein [Bacteroides sp.]